MAKRKSMRERLENHIPEPNTGCWLWMGSVGHMGHGLIGIKRNGTATTIGAHVVAWEIANGRQRPDGMCICHKCDVPACINPQHLFLGTHQDNASDKVQKGRQSHTQGEASGLCRLTENIVLEIRRRYSTSRVSLAAMAREYGVTRANISLIVRRKTWTHIP